MLDRPPNPERTGQGVTGERARAAYEQGLWHESQGDLDKAARCFRRAAEAGYPGAALRLGDVLVRLADRASVPAALTRAGRKTKPSPEMLLAEASRWLSGVSASPDAISLITDMLNRQQRLAARRAHDPEPAGSPT
jgi:TPR repeat protein